MDGIGAGIIYNGELYRGSNHIAGEFGHTLIDIKGEKCSCGRIGCLETVASGKALVEYVLQEKDNDYIMHLAYCDLTALPDMNVCVRLIL